MLLIATALLLLQAAEPSAPAASPPPQGDSQDVATPVAPVLVEAPRLTQEQQDQRVVCRRERVLGSNRAERICATVGERRAISDQARRDMDQAEGRGQAAPGDGDWNKTFQPQR